MALSKITYTDKETLNPLPSVADKNKVTDSDMNEIKSVVNDAIDQVKANTIPQQATAPDSPSENDLWIDTDEPGVINIDNTPSTSSTNPIENQAITNYVNDANSYRETEYKTGGKWIDNKPIYKKTIYVPSLPNATNVDYNHNISNVDTIWIDISSSFIKWANGATSPFNYLGTNSANPTLNTAIEVRLANATKFSIETYGADRTSLSAYVTLLYTKTTD